mmetsp:Transcript_47820/g.74650  ORF Transcript_47820/g.74650 Transcript_47820/m.74650 type:complete len:227 (+) Transcript_47820:201-881(+)
MNTFLDAGAAVGVVLQWLKHNASSAVGENWKIDAYGVELSKEALHNTPWPDLVTQRKLVQGSLTEIPFESDFFDLVYTHEVLEHLRPSDVPAVLGELARVSKGRIIGTISLRFAGADDPENPHLHLTVRSRAAWDNSFANAGCYPDLDFLSSISSTFPLFSEPWVFAYICPPDLSAQEASEVLEDLRNWKHDTNQCPDCAMFKDQHYQSIYHRGVTLVDSSLGPAS